MQIRCNKCRTLNEVAAPAAPEEPLRFTCRGCASRYRVSVNRPTASAETSRYQNAKAFAEANGIEMAAAYSVLEGIMSLEEARQMRPVETGGRGRPQPESADATTGPPLRPPAPAVPAKPAGETDYDPGFADAVRDGCLTAQQAMERGDRQSLIARLAQRHRLTPELAAQVADNRTTVHLALQRKRDHERRVVERPPASISHRLWNVMVLGMGALILGGLLVRAWAEWDDYLAARAQAATAPAVPAVAGPGAVAPPAAPAAPAPPTPSLTLPRTDAAGQLVEVSGPDPRSVLVAFCNTGRNAGRRQPFGIGPSLPPSAAGRMGLFRSLDQPEAPLRAIRIWREARSGRWSAGNGHDPITTEPAPDLPPGLTIVPVGAGADIPADTAAPTSTGTPDAAGWD